MLVSTVYTPTERVLQNAKIWAKRLNCSFVSRNNLSIRKLQALDQHQEVIIVAEQEVKGYFADQPPVFFHPSSAMIRVKRLVRGERDTLLQAADVEKGDKVLDCTAGLASDSIVLSHAVGEIGKVTATEKSLLLYWLVKDGLRSYHSEVIGLNEAMRRIELIHADYLNYLYTLQDKSFDIVYFDPMFRMPLKQSSSMQPLRYWAKSDPVSVEAVTQAKRVARKTVVLKENRNSPEFSRLGFEHVWRSYSNIAYGVIHL